MEPTGGIDSVRAIADAVLYEGYLLYPYRSTSSKNASRWQFGVLGPPGAAEAGLGEAPTMRMQCPVSGAGAGSAVTVHLRFLQMQHRQVIDRSGAPVPSLVLDGVTSTTWDEAVEQERELRFELDPEVGLSQSRTVEIEGGEESESLAEGSPAALVRRRWPIHATVELDLEPRGADLALLSVEVRNVTDTEVRDRDDAVRRSLVGAHLVAEAHACSFVSVVDPPEAAAGIARACSQDRCWPFLAGPEGETHLLLGSPIILYDHPEIAEQSAGALFDATEIDEILTLRVMTMTDQEKAEARATDRRAAEIIDRCDAMTPETLQQMHGILRDPRAEPDGPDARTGMAGLNGVDGVDAWDAMTGLDGLETIHTPGSTAGTPGIEPFDGFDPDVPWWDPAADASVQPEVDSVLIAGVRVAKGSLVEIHPKRRADAQDLFYEGQQARVTAVLSDVDGGTHVAVVLADDPAADLHEWYGRYLYFAPDELEPVDPANREESRR